MTRYENSAAARRRSPGWVRALDDRQLHAVTLRMQYAFWENQSSEQQEWLFDVCVSELEYRRRYRSGHGGVICSCELCLPPFEGSWWEQDPRKSS